MRDCVKYRVTPVTCKARYKPPGEQNSEIRRRVEEVKNRASCDILLAVIEQEQVKLKVKQNLLQERLSILNNLVSVQVREEMERLFISKKNRVVKGCVNTHKNKLQSLLVKEGRNMVFTDSNMQNTLSYK